jgi:O-acetyl-ADP-ribose deacetylase (regulator of RNase III)
MIKINMGKISVEVKTGDITYQDVDLLVNSSNSYLLLGSGTSEQIRKAGGNLPDNDKGYWSLVNQADESLKTVLDYIHSIRPIPSIVQKECLEHIIEKNNSKELELGDAILTSSGNLSKALNKAKYIAHAVGMTYNWKVQPNPPIIPATFESVRDSLIKSFDIATELKCVSLAMPVMCTRKGDLTNEESSKATLQAIENLRTKKTTVNKIDVVLYSPELEKEKAWFQGFYNNSLNS